MISHDHPNVDRAALRAAAEGMLEGIKTAYEYARDLNDPSFDPGHLRKVMWIELTCLGQSHTGWAFDEDALAFCDPNIRNLNPMMLATSKGAVEHWAEKWTWAHWRLFQNKLLKKPANGDHVRWLEQRLREIMHSCDEILERHRVIDIVHEIEGHYEVHFIDTQVIAALRRAEIAWVEAMEQNEVQAFTEEAAFDEETFHANVAKWRAMHPDARRREQLIKGLKNPDDFVGAMENLLKQAISDYAGRHGIEPKDITAPAIVKAGELLLAVKFQGK